MTTTQTAATPEQSVPPQVKAKPKAKRPSKKHPAKKMKASVKAKALRKPKMKKSVKAKRRALKVKKGKKPGKVLHFDKGIFLRLSSEMYLKLKKAAKAKGLDLSALVRSKLAA